MFHYTTGNIGTKFDGYFVFYHFLLHMFKLSAILCEELHRDVATQARDIL